MKMDILTRIARHCTPATTPADLADYRSADHLIWTGQFKPKATIPAAIKTIPARHQYTEARTVIVGAKHPRPYLNGPNSNPVRVLFDYPNPLDRWVLLTPTCGNPACINPRHYKAIAAMSKYEDRRGVLPTTTIAQAAFDEDNVQAILEAIDDPDIKDFSHPLDWAEALRRHGVPLVTAGGTATG